jgi:hydrogenase maturation protein HypF
MKRTSISSISPIRRVGIAVRGVVQGVGFRPFVYNAARARGLAGWVRNEAGAVRIEVQGEGAAVEAFLGDLRDRHPPQARIDGIDVQELSPLPLGEEPGVRVAGSGQWPVVSDQGTESSNQQSTINNQQSSNPQSPIPNPYAHSPHPSPLPEGEGTASFHPSPLPEGEETAAFQIRASEGRSAPRPTIPADSATCPECLAEIRDPSQRRYNYPFTNCTNCGPRWSIIEQLPYDRPRTSLARFEMCPECRAEYEDPADRRFHAQPIACPRCGPTLHLLDCRLECGDSSPHSKDALNAAARLLLEGRIVALKGLGGFQLLVDAANAEAVAILRQRKRRPDRPFAIMVATLDEARRYCEVSDAEAKLLSSHRAPIVLLRRLTSVCDDFNGSPGSQSGGVLLHSSLSTLHSPLSTFASPLSPVPGVAPGNPYLGVMLPYTPLHHLLLAAVGRPVVCTSGNLAEEPMAITIEDARRRLGPIADAILTHDRPIVRPVDDSIVRVGPTGPQVLRRARGFAPLPIDVRLAVAETPTVLAVGGHLKNTVALALRRVRATHHDPASVGAAVALPPLKRQYNCRYNESVRASTHPTQVVMSAHIGDLDNVLSVEVFRRAIDDLVNFFQVEPDAVACDLHPDYASTRHAERLSAEWGVPLVRVQHHHAHVTACMAEHGLQGPVLGFSWDGTGYGPDGTVWGGEALWCDGAEYSRVAHLRTFALPGGDAAVREPRRSALGLLFEMLGPQAADYASQWSTPRELTALMSMLAEQVNSPRTSSMGRLFDAVAALCGLPPVISFEGQAAMALEYAADENERETYNIVLSPCGAGVSPALPVQPGRLHHNTVGQVADLSHDIIVLDWEPLVRSVLADRAAGVPVSRISARFHNALADAAAAIAQAIFGHAGNPPCDAGVSPASVQAGRPHHNREGQVGNLSCNPAIVLSGGCFQNALLTARVHSRLSAAGFPVYTHHEVPPGDGGIALGQVFVALQRLC